MKKMIMNNNNDFKNFVSNELIEIKNYILLKWWCKLE